MDEMIKYTCIYKCKLCGMVVNGADIIVSEEDVKNFKENLQSADAGYVFHVCKNEDIGICEYVGLRNRGEAGYNDILHNALCIK